MSTRRFLPVNLIITNTVHDFILHCAGNNVVLTPDVEAEMAARNMLMRLAREASPGVVRRCVAAAGAPATQTEMMQLIEAGRDAQEQA